MKTKSILKALEKVGLKAETSYHGPNLHYLCKTQKRKLSWYANGDTGEAHCVHVSRLNDEWRPDIDSFPGFFVDTIKEAIKYLTKE